MWHKIDVDSEVYEHLKREAEPFVDTPNTVLRRVLGLPGAGDALDGAGPVAPSVTLRSAKEVNGQAAARGVRGTPSRAKPGARNRGVPKTTRAPAGSILPESEYEQPLLECLREAGGTAPSKEIIEAVGRRLDSRLTDVDREPLASGSIRWQNRIQFVRLKLIERGLMTKDSPRGTWALAMEATAAAPNRSNEGATE